MKMFFVLTCCLGVAFGAHAVDAQGTPPPKKKGGPAQQASQHVTGTGPGHAVGPGHVAGPGHAVGAGQKLQTQHGAYTGGTRTTSRTGTSSQTFQAQHFNLSTKAKPTSAGPAVTYRAGSRIQGSQTWQGSSYTAFRSYSPQWHDRNWWGSHHNRIVFVFGSPYYWDSGYWYPAWGYDPYASYYYDGPIYAYNDLPPDQVIANVQAALQARGYYEGEVDGVLGPLTRAAIANYQRDQGLYITSAIDEPTLASLGMV